MLPSVEESPPQKIRGVLRLKPGRLSIPAPVEYHLGSRNECLPLYSRRFNLREGLVPVYTEFSAQA